MIAEFRPCFTERVTSPFGARINPITKKQEFHNGVDISPTDKIKYLHEPIKAIADGTVALAYGSKEIGINVQIDHGNGYRTRNFHLHSRLVNRDEKVVAGQVIGFMGTTGSSTAQHLHFEIRRNGKPVDPIPFIKGKPFESEEEMMLERIKKVLDVAHPGALTKQLADQKNTSMWWVIDRLLKKLGV